MFLLSKSNTDSFQQWLQAAPVQGSALLVDKSTDWTSFDVVAKLRNLFRIKKIGHAGTLDPLATGLLIVCLGKATKSINEFQDLHKTYTGTIKLGATTVTDDSEAEEQDLKPFHDITIEQIQSATQQFVGNIQQIPPKYSAKKINGQRSYFLARKHKDFELQPSSVEVYRFDINEINLPFLRFSVQCSKGTYIRSLARDVGAVLGCGAYLSSLRRTAIGEFNVDNALTIEEISECVKLMNTNNLNEHI